MSLEYAAMRRPPHGHRIDCEAVAKGPSRTPSSQTPIMLFYSLQFIFLFLPLAVLVYYALSGRSPRLAEVVLVGFSLVFYAYYKTENIFIILSSILVNFGLGQFLAGGRTPSNGRRHYLLVLGIAFNVLLLVYFKYTNFIVDNINLLAGSALTVGRITLPLAISFFTFQQIAYLHDAYLGKSTGYTFGRYALFVSFFPQLVAGPIVHHREMMPQFADDGNKTVNWENIYAGLIMFIIGLFKKIVIADTFAVWATAGFSDPGGQAFFEAWRASLSYTVQLYFDFSGYADMAIGIALLFNIHLPINFDSPYRALDIQDFWRRWHITLSRFLREYLYFPLGGNRQGAAKTYRNLLIVFLIGGVWHGAGWTFVVWGLLHGLAICAARLWRTLKRPLHRPVAWLSTFLFVNAAWVFFRADSVPDAMDLLAGMAGMHGVAVSRSFGWAGRFGATIVDAPFVVSIPLVFLLVLILQDVFFRNSQQWVMHLKPTWRWSLSGCAFFITSIAVSLQHERVSEFIYWQF